MSAAILAQTSLAGGGLGEPASVPSIGGYGGEAPRKGGRPLIGGMGQRPPASCIAARRQPSQLHARVASLEANRGKLPPR